MVAVGTRAPTAVWERLSTPTLPAISIEKGNSPQVGRSQGVLWRLRCAASIRRRLNQWTLWSFWAFGKQRRAAARRLAPFGLAAAIHIVRRLAPVKTTTATHADSALCDASHPSSSSSGRRTTYPHCATLRTSEHDNSYARCACVVRRFPEWENTNAPCVLSESPRGSSGCAMCAASIPTKVV